MSMAHPSCNRHFCPSRTTMMRKVIFLFTHTVLGRIWARAAAVLAGEGIELKVLNQMQSIDWESNLTDRKSVV